jgi:hypothetical protein
MALLFVFGRTGWIGAPASHIGISFYGTQWGIIAAMLLVSVPFAVNSARVAFESIDPSFENAARSLGATHGYAFRRVTLPLALRGVFTVSLNRIVDHILPTVPLVRVQLAGEPPLTALVLNRELTRLRLRPGQPVEVQLPADSIKALARPRTSTTGGPLTIECARTTRVI